MEARRRWLVYALVSVVAGGHLYDLAVDREHWPFSPYPMYAHSTDDWTVLVPRIMGVRGDATGEVIFRDDDWLAPFDQARLLQSVQTMLGKPDGRRDAATALADCLARYERRRRAGEVDGPALRALRLYYMRFTLSTDPAAVDRPERRDLVLEVPPS
jgi:hypothetical protein